MPSYPAYKNYSNQKALERRERAAILAEERRQRAFERRERKKLLAKERKMKNRARALKRKQKAILAKKRAMKNRTKAFEGKDRRKNFNEERKNKNCFLFAL